MIPKSRLEPVVHNSLGLSALCQWLQGKDTWEVLELGPVRRDNIEFWSRYCNSVYVADLRSSLPLTAMAEDSPCPEWADLLRLPEGRRFDIILAWDLLNYLQLQDAARLIEYLSPFCRPGTVLFTLIFDQPQMPEAITIYKIVDEQHISYEYCGLDMRACPRHRPRPLAGAMRRFKTSSSFRLRNGIVEYLFAYEGEGDA